MNLIPQKTNIKNITIKIAKTQLTSLIPVPVPIIQVADYIISNRKFIQKKKCRLLMHHKKIAKVAPGIAASDVLNSDFITSMIEHIPEHHIHDTAMIGIQALKLYLVIL
jgi:hypothetical protein